MTFSPGIYDITIYQGASFTQVLTWKDSAGTLLNLTGYKARMMARTSVDSATAFLTLTTENGGITLGGAAGTITFTVSATGTAALSQSGVYDLELVSADGTVTRLMQGSLLLSREVTR